jgi:uncharacterized membrane protein (DUF2068 family)
VDWNLRVCGWRGHVTYAPNEESLRDRLHAETPVGTAWRCLRCGDFTLGAPKRGGPAENAPLVARGKALQDAIVLRVLAVERFLRALLILFGAYLLYRFRSSQNAAQRAFTENLPLIRPIADKLGWNLEDSSIMHTIRSVIEARSSTLLWAAVGLAVYGILQVIEALGLWLLKRWGEYFAVVATSLGIPIEIYEIAERTTAIRIGALVINLAAVLYILLSKRLFGLRGGHAAYEAERHVASLLEVEVAAGMKPAAGAGRGRAHVQAEPADRAEAQKLG